MSPNRVGVPEPLSGVPSPHCRPHAKHEWDSGVPYPHPHAQPIGGDGHTRGGELCPRPQPQSAVPKPLRALAALHSHPHAKHAWAYSGGDGVGGAHGASPALTLIPTAPSRHPTAHLRVKHAWVPHPTPRCGGAPRPPSPHPRPTAGNVTRPGLVFHPINPPTPPRRPTPAPPHAPPHPPRAWAPLPVPTNRCQPGPVPSNPYGDTAAAGGLSAATQPPRPHGKGKGLRGAGGGGRGPLGPPTPQRPRSEGG